MREYFDKLTEVEWKRILIVLVVATVSVRVLILWVLETFDPSYLASVGSLVEGYLFPRLTVIPWKVDWSYGPLTYDLYWGIAQLPANQIVSRSINFLADAGTTYFVAVISRRFISPSRSLLAGAAWAFFPLSISNSVVGAIDALPVLSMIAAVHYALSQNPWRSFLFIAVGFNLKLFPILLLPIIVWTPRRSMRPIHLFAGSILPFILGLFLLLPTSSLSGFTPTSIVLMMFQRIEGRTPSGTSMLNSLTALLPQAQILREIFTTTSYLVMVMLIALITFRKSGSAKPQLVIGSALILFASVNLSVQVQTNYLLWYYPVIFVAILMEIKNFYAIIQLSLLALAIVLNNFFAFARFAQLTHDTLPATSSLFDLVTIVGYQIVAWLLFIILWKRMNAAMILRNTSQETEVRQ